MDRTERLAKALKEAFSPVWLSIDDDIRAHAAHRHRGGGHLSVRIASHRFEGKPLIERHRMVYQAVGDLTSQAIHALSIRAVAPSEESG